ncbi:MAG: 3-oxoacyl-ACP reductase [Proteobacteria bacterium]|nr:MAG: 3-oxoacyl-ACP reductase [Pseudomonadota bacterium]
MAKLDGKVALVTGAGRGIGQAIALKLASEGARIVMNDLDDGPANDTIARITQMGGQAVALNGDITADGFAERFIAKALDSFQGLDIIVNSAGYSWDALIHKTTNEQFDAMLDIHVRAPFKILRAAAGPIRDMAKKESEEGRAVHRKVVNISSIGGLYGNAGQVGYASGKTALIGMTKTLAKEWGRYKVNVNCVAFGLIQTRMTEAFQKEPKLTQVGEKQIKMGVPPEFLESMNKTIPLGRAGTPEDAAGAVYLFCLPESDYISGEVVLVSGGLVI